MANCVLSDVKKLLSDVVDKLTLLETKMMTVERELSTSRAEKQSQFPGLLELRLPKYDGTDNPAIWLHRLEIFFHLQRTEEYDKVSLAAFHMTGAAQIWYCGLKRKPRRSTWPQLTESVHHRFGALTRGNNALGELVRLRHTGSVAEYRDKFPGLLDRCDGVTEPQQVAFFTAGLRDPLRVDVELRRPATLEEATWLARALEHRQELLSSEN